MSPYEIIGVRPDCSDAELKKAYRRRAKNLHPDVSANPDATEQMKRLNQAYAAALEMRRHKNSYRHKKSPSQEWKNPDDPWETFRQRNRKKASSRKSGSAPGESGTRQGEGYKDFYDRDAAGSFTNFRKHKNNRFYEKFVRIMEGVFKKSGLGRLKNEQVLNRVSLALFILISVFLGPSVYRQWSVPDGSEIFARLSKMDNLTPVSVAAGLSVLLLRRKGFACVLRWIFYGYIAVSIMIVLEPSIRGNYFSGVIILYFMLVGVMRA